MRHRNYSLAIVIAITLSVFAAIAMVRAITNTYNCTLSGHTTCGVGYTAYTFQSNINSNSENVLVCAGYQVSGGNPVCTSIYTGQGLGFSGSSSVSFSSYYHNTSPYTTVVNVSDVYCNCFSPQGSG
jgi:hypothetical protein